MIRDMKEALRGDIRLWQKVVDREARCWLAEMR